MSSPTFPAIPLQGTDKNSKLFLDMLAGRMGVGNRAVTFGDLFDSGILELASGVSVGDLDPNNPGNGITLPPGTTPDKPTTPTDLGTASSWGAIFLSWEYEAYDSEAGTEVWRSVSNDINTAGLLAVATGRTYTDNVGEKQTYYYWVRNRNTEGRVSGYNAVTGVVGTSNMIQTAEDFVLDNPEAEFVPFTIVNYGDETTPDWRILLNGQVIIVGDLSIGQLITGEMRPDSTFTIGNGSIQLGTDGNGKGYMIVTGDDGIDGNDYLYLNAGVLQTYIYDPNIGSHVQYKELRRVERGVTQNGVQTIIPAYFKSEPNIQLSFEDITVYSPAHSAQGQSLRMNAGQIVEHPTVNGSYMFTPTAGLFLADGVSNTVENLDSGDTSSDNNVILNSLVTHNNGKQFVTQFTVSSAKNADGSNYQNRQVLITMQGSLNSGAYTSLASKVVNLSGSGTAVVTSIDSGLQTQGDWVLRFVFNASDRAGTEPSGGDSYTYEEFLNIATGDTTLRETDVDTLNISFDIVSNRPLPVDSAMKLYSIDYKATIEVETNAWYLCTQTGGSLCNTALAGRGEASYPIAVSNTFTLQSFARGTSGGAVSGSICNTFQLDSDSSRDVDTDTRVVGTDGKINFSDDAEPYISGRFSATPVSLKGQSYEVYAGCKYGYAKAKAQVTSYDVSYYYRKPKTVNLTPINRFKADSTAADLGATEISIDNATINWVAIGE